MVLYLFIRDMFYILVFVHAINKFYYQIDQIIFNTENQMRYIN